MYFYKIRTNSNVIYEGISSNMADLKYLLKRKIELNNLEGRVEILSGKKVIEKYDLKAGGVMLVREDDTPSKA